ncbi:MAG: CrcB family protein [Nocardioidaceae bacterium]
MSRHPLTATLLVAVAAGGAVGAVLRWGLDELAPDGTGFPWTTFAINVSGSFLLALLPALPAVRRHAVVAVGLGPGVLGGYTTLSTYSEQTRALMAGGATVLAGTYLLGTLAACLVAVHLATVFSTPAEQHEFEDEEGNE